MRTFIFGIALSALPVVASAQTQTAFGTPGLIDMPTAESAPDAELSSNVSYFAGSLRTTLSFQITPRLSGSFRYSTVERIKRGGGPLFDRSFDLRYRLLDERKYTPAIAIGFQDIIGTGIYAGEYIVATKHVVPSVAVTGGIGWGRFGTFNGFSNPLGGIDSRFNTRPTGFTGTGGIVEAGRWFRGNAGFFGGISWKASPKLTLKAEYSSDAYTRETNKALFKRKSPYNFGLDYQVSKAVNLQLNYLYGSEIGAGVTFKLNPKHPSIVGGLERAPQPVRVRVPTNVANLGWTNIPNAAANIRKAAKELMTRDGLVLEAMSIKSDTATIRVRNGRYTASAEAIGRTARIMTQVMPDSVETFNIVPVSRGIALSKITLRRSDLEVLEHDPNGTKLSYQHAKITDAAARDADLVYSKGLYPRFRWGIGPYLSASYFDPDSPIRAEIGLEATAAYDIAPGLVISGAVRKRAGGNKHTATRVSDSIIQRVRSDGNIYNREGDPALTNLTLAYNFRPGKNLYGRVTVGYLEKMYGGISTELLWKRVNSPFALGAELNYVKQRDFNQLFGFQSYEVATGHLTAYWDMGNGFHSQASVGRYLGGDYGGTLKVERIFANGWRVGAYATLTDTPFSDFGEGSFDKGLTFTVPLDHFIGSPKRKVFNTVLQPLSRDGGARLDVDGRLYETIRSSHNPELVNSWGRFWR
ncbi:YjbH domain-containing protein [Planktotalea sp.]|uniref:YjbH domain-containing protein n=1 Tax=Planktotalea sp. TaxID=2029877 RepID=UPI003D6B12F6